MHRLCMFLTSSSDSELVSELLSRFSSDLEAIFCESASISPSIGGSAPKDTFLAEGSRFLAPTDEEGGRLGRGSSLWGVLAVLSSPLVDVSSRSSTVLDRACSLCEPRVDDLMASIACESE